MNTLFVILYLISSSHQTKIQNQDSWSQVKIKTINTVIKYQELIVANKELLYKVSFGILFSVLAILVMMTFCIYIKNREEYAKVKYLELLFCKNKQNNRNTDTDKNFKGKYEILNDYNEIVDAIFND